LRHAAIEADIPAVEKKAMDTCIDVIHSHNIPIYMRNWKKREVVAKRPGDAWAHEDCRGRHIC
jgi:hypothetical protein